MVPGGAAGARRLARARLLRLERDQPEVRRRPHHLHRHRDLELELGRHRQGLLLAPLLPPPAGPEFRQSRGAARGQPGDAVLAGSRRRRAAARRGAVSDRARRDDLREPRGDARRPEEDPRARSTSAIPDRMLLAEANQWPADVRPYFGDGDECHMAFHFPLMPRMFMAVRQEDRHPIVEILRQTPGDPRELPVGDVPAQPRRADARDGDRRGARLHVPGVCRRSADADQRRHPPPPGAADGEQPPPHRAAAQPAVLDARHADHLLRRRDRHGRQHLPRRSQRRAHADAVDRRSQRRLLARRSGAALRAADHGPGLRLPGDQRRGAGALAVLAAQLDEADDRPAQAVPGLRPRHDRVPARREPQGPRLRAPLQGRRDPLRRQPVALGAAGRARPVAASRA